jgi:hypothetical protein
MTGLHVMAFASQHYKPDAQASDHKPDAQAREKRP